ncbi:MAG: hypothetical protein DME21_06955 [Verrucomicrobia bacterium]|nr:MAG: hypothetical protein DME21_06955 [Verrucomicrobiota bacterium]
MAEGRARGDGGMLRRASSFQNLRHVGQKMACDWQPMCSAHLRIHRDCRREPKQSSPMKTKISQVRGRVQRRTSVGMLRKTVGAAALSERTPARLKLKSILPSQKALRYAKSFARRFGARLVLLHVVESVPYTADFGYGPVVRTVPDPLLLKRSQTHLDAIARRQLDSECRCDTLVRSGVAFDEIAKVTKELDVDLIILATRDYTALDHAPLGSTVERVVRHAPCPVLMVRENEHEFIGQSLNSPGSLRQFNGKTETAVCPTNYSQPKRNL